MIFRQIEAAAKGFQAEVEGTQASVAKFGTAVKRLGTAAAALAAVLGDVKAGLLAIELLLTSVKALLKRVGGKSPRLKLVLKQLDVTLGAVKQTVRRIRRAVGKADKGLKGAGAVVAAATSSVDALSRRLAGVGVDVSAVVALAQRLEPQQDPLEDLMPRELLVRLRRLVRDLNRATATLRTVRRRVDSEAGDVRALAASLESATQALKARLGVLQELAKQLEALQPVVEEMADLADAALDVLVGPAKALLALFKDVEQFVDELLGKLLALTTPLDLIRLAIEKLPGIDELLDAIEAVTGVVSKVARLEARVKAIAGRVQAAVDAALAALRELLAKLAALAALKYFLEWVVPRMCDEVVEERERIRTVPRTDRDRVRESGARLGARYRTVARIRSELLVPPVGLEALCEADAAVDALGTGSRSLRRAARGRGEEVRLERPLGHLDRVVIRCEAAREAFIAPPTECDAVYFAGLARAAGLTPMESSDALG